MRKKLLFVLLMLIFAGLMFPPASDVSGSHKASVTPVAFVADAGVSGCSKAEVSNPTSTPAPEIQPTPAAVVPEGPSAASPIVSTGRTTAASFQARSASTDLPVMQETLTIFSTFLDRAERIAQVYLPGDYAQNPAQSYPVLYAFDGQQLPQIGFEQTLQKLFGSGEVSPFIVVAVFSTEGDLRHAELGAGPNINLFGWGTLSDAFNHFVINELVLKVNSSYRTLTGAPNTAVMGWSLGGLTSFYLAWQYPDTFGTVGAFSPSFWWRTESLPGQELQARVIPNLVRSSPIRPGLRMWFEAGTKELPYSDIDGNGVIDMIQDAQDVMSFDDPERLPGRHGYGLC